jgi:hypothetical protein
MPCFNDPPLCLTTQPEIPRGYSAFLGSDGAASSEVQRPDQPGLAFDEGADHRALVLHAMRSPFGTT